MKNPIVNDQYFVVSNTGIVKGPFTVTMAKEGVFRLSNGCNYDIATGAEYGFERHGIVQATAQEFSEQLVATAQQQQVKHSVIDAKNNLISILHSVDFKSAGISELLEASDKIGEFSEFLSSRYMNHEKG